MANTDTTVMRGPYHFPDGATGVNLTPAPTSVGPSALTTDFKLPTSKATHRYVEKYSPTGTVANASAGMFVAPAAGTLIGFNAGSIVTATGNSTVTIDLKKNGASVLTSPITLSSSTAARTMVTGLVSGTAVAAGDFFEVVVVATAGTGTLPSGLLAQLVIDTDPA